MDQSLVFDLDLINKYDYAGPRYTSYPTAPQFHEGFGEEQYREAALKSNASGQPLSLYFHIPFCDTVCFYCACNKIATKDRSLNQPYLDRLYKEIQMQGELFDNSRKVEQLHWGGGTPTFISHDQMRELMSVTGKHFRLADDDTGEYSIEIDPREAQGDTVKLLRELGFNRMSLGVQDFDERVQKAVNRLQTKQETLSVLQAARDEGFRIFLRVSWVSEGVEIQPDPSAAEIRRVQIRLGSRPGQVPAGFHRFEDGNDELAL